MQSADGPQRAALRLAHFLRKYCFWLLVACYALAALWPAPGQGLRHWRWSPAGLPAAEFTLPLVLLALLLFCAAVQTDVAHIRSIGTRPWPLVWGTIAVWLAPALLVMAAAVVLPLVIERAPAAQLLVGLALVASMPVANSSVGWTQLVRGNLALSLGLVMVTIFLSPWITPWMLDSLQHTLSPPDRSLFQTLVAKFSGTFFILWVVLPTAAGLAARHSLGAERVGALAAWINITSVVSLLALNYMNAAVALQQALRESPLADLTTTAILALAISAIGMAAGGLVARLMRLDSEARLALVFGLGMKHTGLALLLAGAVLAEQKLAILMIVLATLAQHLLAGVVQWRTRSKFDLELA
jgi:bile acid:Na+ symporter, BASS family